MGNHLMKACAASSEDSTNSEAQLIPDTGGEVPHPNATMFLSDFDILRPIGQGTYGSVALVRKRADGITYALKYINKEKCIQQSAIRNVINERRLLQRLYFPLICNLQAAFQDYDNLYLLLDPMLGSDLLYNLDLVGCFSEDCVKFFIGEISLALEYLHKRRIVHRDVKPPNLLLDEKGHCHLTDFNVAGRTHADRPMLTTAGTYNYMAPEIFQKNGYDERVDWWSLGVTMFELLYGKPPFRGKTRADVREAVLNHKITIPKKSKVTLSPECQYALDGFMRQEVEKRNGPAATMHFKEIPWLSSLDFSEMEKKTCVAPYIPNVESMKKDIAFYASQALMDDLPLRPRKNSLKTRKEELEEGTPWHTMRQEFAEFDRSNQSINQKDEANLSGSMEADESKELALDDLLRAHLDDDDDKPETEREAENGKTTIDEYVLDKSIRHPNLPIVFITSPELVGKNDVLLNGGSYALDDPLPPASMGPDGSVNNNTNGSNLDNPAGEGEKLNADAPKEGKKKKKKSVEFKLDEGEDEESAKQKKKREKKKAKKSKEEGTEESPNHDSGDISSKSAVRKGQMLETIPEDDDDTTGKSNEDEIASHEDIISSVLGGLRKPSVIPPPQDDEQNKPKVKRKTSSSSNSKKKTVEMPF